VLVIIGELWDTIVLVGILGDQRGSLEEIPLVFKSVIGAEFVGDLEHSLFG
jgi:hypothetical protein